MRRLREKRALLLNLLDLRGPAVKQATDRTEIHERTAESLKNNGIQNIRQSSCQCLCLCRSVAVSYANDLREFLSADVPVTKHYDEFLRNRKIGGCLNESACQKEIRQISNGRR